MNIIFLMAIFLWFIGKVESNKSKNPFRVYSAFVVVVGAGFSWPFSPVLRRTLWRS